MRLTELSGVECLIRGPAALHPLQPRLVILQPRAAMPRFLQVVFTVLRHAVEADRDLFGIEPCELELLLDRHGQLLDKPMPDRLTVCLQENSKHNGQSARVGARLPSRPMRYLSCEAACFRLSLTCSLVLRLRWRSRRTSSRSVFSSMVVSWLVEPD